MLFCVMNEKYVECREGYNEAISTRGATGSGRGNGTPAANCVSAGNDEILRLLQSAGPGLATRYESVETTDTDNCNSGSVVGCVGC